MADAPASPPLTEDGLVRAYSPGGEKIRVRPEEVARLEQAGGKLATAEDLATIRLNEIDAEKLAARRSMSTGELLGDAAREAAGKVGTQIGGYLGGGLLGGTVATLAPTSRKVEAFGQGANDAATFGLAKLGAKSIASITGGPEAVRQEQERRAALEQSEGGATMLGQIGGTVSQAIATSGTGQGGRAAAFLDPIGLAGNAAEQGIAKAIAGVAAKGVVGRAAATAAKLGVRGAVEGALQGGAGEVTDALFADRELAGEKVAAAMGHGALFGGLTGAGLGFAGSIASSGVGKARDGLARFAGKTRGAADELAGDAATGLVRLAEEADGVVAKAADALPSAGKAERALQRESNEAAARALGGTRLNVRKLTQELGDDGMEKVGKFVTENYLSPAVKEQGTIRGIMDSTPEALLPKIQADVQTTGAAIGRTLKESGSVVEFSKVKAGLAELAEAARKEGPSGVAAAKRMETVVANMDEALRARGVAVDAPGASIPVHELATLRQDLASIGYSAKVQGESRYLDLVKSWERNIQSNIIEALPEAAQGELKALNERYRMLKLVETVAETGAERALGNNRIGLRDTIIGAGALASGNLIGGVAALGGSKLINRYGDAMAAVLLQRAAESGSVVRAVQRIDGAVSRAAKGIVEGVAPKSAKASRPVVDPRPRARQVIARVAAAQADGVGFGDRVRKSASSLHNAPEVSAAYETASVKAATFLASKMPQSMAAPDPLRPERNNQLTKQDAAKVLRYADALKDPTIAFDDIARGKVNREAIEVLREVYPKLYGQLQQQTLKRLTDAAARGKAMPYATRVRIGVVLGMDADPSMRPDMMRALQANVMPVQSTEGGAPSGGAPPQSPRRPLQTNPKTQQAGLDAVE